jgi:hypothetical protein
VTFTTITILALGFSGFRLAANVLPIIREALKAGARTLREIAAALNARGVATARSGRWHAKSESNMLERAWRGVIRLATTGSLLIALACALVSLEAMWPAMVLTGAGLWLVLHRA